MNSRISRSVMWLLFVLLSITTVSRLAALPAHIETSLIQTDASLQLIDSRLFAANTVAHQYRLPNNTRPTHYDIELTTHVTTGVDFNFNGRVRITLEALQPQTRTIQLHQRQLRIGAVQLTNATSGQLIRTDALIEYNDVTELLTVRLAAGEADLIVGQRYVLHVAYAGTLREDFRGFFRSSYAADDGQRRWLAVTHFEPTNARHGFPCFDEPGLRATFTVRLTYGAEYHAVSNMPVEWSELSADRQMRTTQFAVTPPMPTYMLAFVISDFASISVTNPDTNFTQHLYARPNAVQTGSFGLELASRIIEAFAQRFGVAYTLPKMDHIAVPGYRGAMEHWGLIIYNERVLLWSEELNTAIEKVSAAVTIVHEFAHQWFGNLVTNQWWTYSWLKEGFAKLYEYHGTDWLFPQWRILDKQKATQYQMVMMHDSTNETRPMSRYVETNTDIAVNFDGITYSKSGSVLNMFLNAFTEAKFTEGLTRFLQQNANSVATEAELFAAMQSVGLPANPVSDQHTVAATMGSWTQQAGYPLVTVQRNYKTGAVHLSQQRYFSDARQPADHTTFFWIPYNWASPSAKNYNDTAATGWLAPSSSVTEVQLPLAAGDWLLLNKRQTGYYRVLYDTENYRLLAAALSSDRHAIHVASRSQLLDDAFDLAQAERLDYGSVFDLAKYLVEETEYVPWVSALRGLHYVDRLHSGSLKFGAYRIFIAKLLTKFYTDLGLIDQPNEHVYRQEARLYAIRWACLYEVSLCAQQTNALLDLALNNTLGPAVVHETYRSAILCAGARSASDAQYALIAERLDGERTPAVRSIWIEALSCASNTEQLRRMLERTLSGQTEENAWTRDERAELFRWVSDNRAGIAVVVQVLAARPDVALELLGANVLKWVVSMAADRVNDAALTKLIGELNLDAIDETLPATVKEKLRANERWIERNQKVIDEWIERNGASPLVMSSLVLMAIVALSHLVLG